MPPAQKATQPPGYWQSRHFSTYVPDVEQLVHEGRTDDAERLLQKLVGATEAEDKEEQRGVAPWYYEQLAIIYRKRKDYASEVAILERYARQRHAPGVKPAQLLERLAKARALHNKHLGA
jgi:hypothetical protein